MTFIDLEWKDQIKPQDPVTVISSLLTYNQALRVQDGIGSHMIYLTNHTDSDGMIIS